MTLTQFKSPQVYIAEIDRCPDDRLYQNLGIGMSNWPILLRTPAQTLIDTLKPDFASEQQADDESIGLRWGGGPIKLRIID